MSRKLTIDLFVSKVSVHVHCVSLKSGMKIKILHRMIFIVRSG